MSGEGQGTRVRFDGALELASKNRLANPRFDIFDNDEPVNLSLGAAPKPAGWGFYARNMADHDALMRQNLTEFPMHRSSFTQRGPLIEGPEPQDVTRKGRIASPFRPLVEVEDNTRAGLSAGWVGIAYAWIVGRSEERITGLTTGPSPRVYANPTEGQVVEIPLPDSAPEGATGIALYLTESQSTENAASQATLYEQRRFAIRDGLRRTHTFTDFSRGREATENRTFAGEMNRLGAPEVKYRRGNRRLKQMTTRLSWSFMTEFGLSEPQSVTQLIDISQGQPRTELAWKPRNIPTHATAWRPELLAANGQWYALALRGKNQWAAINTNEVFEGRTDTGRFASGTISGQGIEQVERNRYASDGDNTGLPSPDSALGEPTVKGVAQIEPGYYAVRGVLYEQDGRTIRETPPSSPVNFRIQTGETFRIHRPPGGNLIPNPRRVEIDRPTQLPKGWDKDESTAGLSVDLLGPQSNGKSVEIVDESTATSREDVALTPYFDCQPDEPAGFRVVFDVKRYVSGTCAAILRFYDADKVWLGGTTSVSLGSAAALGEHVIKSNTTQVSVPTQARYARIALRMIGDTATGARDLDLWARTFAAARGLVAPPEEGWHRNEPEEDENETIPEGGACEIVPLTDADMHSDLAGKTLSGVQYFGPYGTPAHAEHFITDLTTPVRPGKTTTLSIYGIYEGVSVATDYFTTAYIDEAGRTLRVNGPIVPNVFGSADHARYAQTSTAPDEAAYLKVIRGGGSDGYALFYASQIEDGATLTAWEDERALSGWRRLIFDTHLPGTATRELDPTGFSENYFPWLSAIREWREGGVVATEPEGTSVSTRWRSTDDNPAEVASPVYTAWFTNYADVPKKQYQMVEILMEGDGTNTPLVDWAGVSLRRWKSFLCREDGSEYPGGIRVAETSPGAPKRRRETFTSDANTIRNIHTGRYRKTLTLKMVAHTDAACEEAVADLYRGDGHHVIEDALAGKRYVVQLEEFAFEERGQGWPLREDMDFAHYFFEADASGTIVAEETL